MVMNKINVSGFFKVITTMKVPINYLIILIVILIDISRDYIFETLLPLYVGLKMHGDGRKRNRLVMLVHSVSQYYIVD